MKNINKLLAILLLVIFIVACTNEEEFTDSKNIKVNNKNLDKSDFSPISPFPEYEQIDITGEQAKVLLINFNKAMNNQMSMPNMEIKQALLAMEMYFNYAIVDKNKNYDITASYQEQSFEFTVNVDDNTISGEELKTNFRQFLIGIKDAMSNKFMKFSDLFVSSKTGSIITFKIIIPPYLEGMDTHNAAMITVPSCPVVREVGDIPSVPENVVIDWGVYFDGWVSSPGTGYAGFPYFWDNSQEILHSYCIKPLDFFVYGIVTDNNIQTSLFDLSKYYYRSDDRDNHPYFYYNYEYNNNEIMNYLIPATLLAADDIRQELDNNLLLLNITPKLDFPYRTDLVYSIGFGGLKISDYTAGNVIPKFPWDDIIFNY
jgi:hypothetical protein